jgi:hypothetical protein
MNKLFNMLLALSLAFVLPGYFSTAVAFTAYTSEANFVAALESYYLEEFNDLEMDGGESSLARGPVNGFSYRIEAMDSSGDSSDLYFMDQSLSTNGPAHSLVFTFTGDDVTAFGGFLWPTTLDCSNAVAGIDVEMHFTGGNSETYAIQSAAFDTFTGFISDDAITSIIFSENGDSVWTDGDGLFVSADHVYAGASSSVPIPAAVWLLGSGLVSLISIRKKRNN